MLLKKQTVWLLTMLSLVVVLSVYYVTSDPSKSNVATTSQDAKTKQTAQKKVDKEVASQDKNTKVNTTEASDVFETVRMEKEDKRSKLRDDLTSEIAEDDISAQDKNKAYAKMQNLTETAQTEKVLESLIKSEGYSDALVEADGSNITVKVKSNKSDKKSANKIVNLIEQQTGNVDNVVVTFQN